ncbi:MAG: hypothetical protein Tsb0020_12480 [Haliangiales bacterium]
MTKSGDDTTQRGRQLDDSELEALAKKLDGCQASREALAEALAGCEALKDDEIRALIVRRLPNGVRVRAQSHPGLRLSIGELVATCARYPRGLAALYKQMRRFEGESRAMAAVTANDATLACQTKLRCSETSTRAIRRCRSLTWILGIALFMASHAHADSPIALKAGATASQAALESPGLSLGGSLSGPRWQPFPSLVLAPQLETFLVRRHTGLVSSAENTSYTLDFLEVLLLMRAELMLGSRSFYAMAGGYGSHLLGANEINSDGIISSVNMARQYDFGLMVAGGLSLASSSWGELFTELRYQHGYLSLLPESQQQHQTYSLLVGYGLGINTASNPSLGGSDRRLMLKAGLVTTRFQSPGAAASSYAPGFTFGGAFSPARLGSWIALIPQLELAFVHRGEHHDVMQAGSLSLEDIEASALVRSEVTIESKVLYGVAGLYASALIRAQRHLDGEITSMRGTVRPVNAGWLAGIGAEFVTLGDAKLLLEVRFQRSLLPRFADPDDVTIQASMPTAQESVFAVIGLRYGAPSTTSRQRQSEPDPKILHSANDQGEGRRSQRSGRAVSVRVARISDRWLEDLQFYKIEASHHDGQYGYQVTYLIPSRKEKGKQELEIFFWGRDEIDFDDSSPKSYKSIYLPLKEGRLVRPTRITSKSLPSVHYWILELEKHHAAQANGAIKAMEGFMVVAALGGSKPTIRATPPRGSPRVGGAASSTGGTAKGAAQAVGQGFRSFSELKRAMGPAGKGMQWHHIVEQGGINITRFGAEMIHNTSNVVRVEIGIHRKISAFYSSKQGFTGGQTVRNWLRTQSFEEQMEFGLVVLQRFIGAP